MAEAQLPEPVEAESDEETTEPVAEAVEEPVAGDESVDAITEDVAVVTGTAVDEAATDEAAADHADDDVSLMEDATADSDADGEVNPDDASPFGAGSAAPADDGSGPEGWGIKGNADSMLYHTPDSRYYKVTKAEVWFDTEENAEAAGFAKPGSTTKDED